MNLEIEEAELIYVWIEKYRNIEKCAYPINRNFEVVVNDVEGEKEVTIKNLNEEALIYDYEDINVSSVSLLVGKNGVGKSNFLWSIAGDDYLEKDNQIMFLIYYDYGEKDYIIENYNMKIKYGNENKIIKYGTNIQINSINSYCCYGGPSVGTEYMFIGDFEKFPNANGEGGIPRYGNTFRNLGLDYGLEYLLQGKKLENIHNEIVFRLDRRSDEVIDVQKILSGKYPGQTCGFDVMKDDPYKLFPEAFMLRLLGKWINVLEQHDYRYIRLEDDLNQCTVNEIIKIPDVDELIENLEIVNSNGDYVEDKTSKVKEVCWNIRKLIKKLVGSQGIKFKSSFQCSILVEDIGIKIDKVDIKELFKWLHDEEFYNDIIQTELLKVEYSKLSEGEKYRAKLFSCMELGFEHNKNIRWGDGILKHKKIILILDEPDAHFHPEWSRCFISDLFKFLKERYSDKIFQIIISTHSPFMVSDVPCEHILKISSYKEGDNSGKSVVEACKEPTFGANIHSLLRNTFFMDATIGEFSRQSINKIIKKLDEGKIEEKEKRIIKRRIDSIGEPIIRRKLQERYYRSFKEISEVDKIIDSLKEKISDTTSKEAEEFDKIEMGIQEILRQMEARKKQIKEESI